MSSFLIGMLVGSIAITGLISRVLDKYAFKTMALIPKAVVVALITLGAVVAFAALIGHIAVPQAAFNYGIGVAIWLLVDLVRAVRKQRKSEG